MKIVFVCDTMGPGGAERVISILSNNFVRFGHEVSIVMLSKIANGSFYSLNGKIGLHNLFKDKEKDLSFFHKAKKLRNCLQSLKADIVISFISYVCIYTWWALRKTKIPYIVSERNDPNQRPKLKQIMLNKSFKKSSGCIFQTEDAFEWYKKIVGNKSTIIYNPVEIPSFNTTAERLDKQILYVGRLNEQKNLFMLLDAFKVFVNKHPDFTLKMYGDGSLKQPLIDYINKNELSSKVTMVSSSKDWQNKEQGSKMFVLPSKYEGMPNVLAEALCLGIPSVSTNCTIGGPKELKKLFPELLVLSEGSTAESFEKAMEDCVNKQNKEAGIPSQLTAESITLKWLNFIKQIKH